MSVAAITGATGFLGLRLIPELLTEHESLLVLARRRPALVAARIGRFLQGAGESEAAVHEAMRRIEIVTADVALPRLGLSGAELDRLADRFDVMWHCAGDISLDPENEKAMHTNTEGARHIIELVSHGIRRPLLCHVSTVAVAGARAGGTVLEEELDGSYGFQIPYDRSKYEAEVLIRNWAASSGRPAVVFRPSGLITTRPPAPGEPQHLVQTAIDFFKAALHTVPQWAAGTQDVKLYGIPEDACANFVLVEDAAHVMTEAVRRVMAQGVTTFHIVHRRDIPAVEMAELLSHCTGLRWHMEPGPLPGTVSQAERALHESLGMYLPWVRLARHYDTTNLSRLGLACDRPAAPDRDFLLSTLTSPMPPEFTPPAS